MKKLDVKWKVYARDGNTCYRPASDGSKLREVFEKSLSSLGYEVDISLKEVLLTAADDTKHNHLVIEDRKLSEWVKEMEHKYRTLYESEIHPGLQSGEFDELTRDSFLAQVLTLVLDPV